MATALIYKNSTGEIIWSQRAANAELWMAKRTIEMRGYDVFEYAPYLAAETIGRVKDFVIRDGVVTRKEATISEAKEQALKIVADSFSSICAGTDPVTGKSIYADCETSSGKTFRMNAGAVAASNMSGGVQIAQGEGLSLMPEVRDFYNVDHGPDDGTEYVSVPVAHEIALKQGADARLYWRHKGLLDKQINAATTVGEVRAIDLKFPVNVEV